jgi:calcineurin-like phosphoesterase family protein
MEKCGPTQGFCVRGDNFASDRTRVYVIGDIHGRADLLDRMVDHISRDLHANPISDCVTVTLGDYIDRGPDSRGVLDRLVRNPFPTDFIALKGNHEALLEANYEQATRALELAVPPGEHFKFLASLKASIITGKYFLCHGGVRPGIALERKPSKTCCGFGRVAQQHHGFRQDRRSRAHAERAARSATEPDQHRHRSVCDRPADLRRARGCATSLPHDGLRVSSDAAPQGETSFRIIEKIF